MRADTLVYRGHLSQLGKVSEFFLDSEGIFVLAGYIRITIPPNKYVLMSIELILAICSLGFPFLWLDFATVRL